MSADLKRKRAKEPTERNEKRRHVSPDTQLSDADMLDEDRINGENQSEDENENDDDEDSEENEQWTGIGGEDSGREETNAGDAEHHTGTQPKKPPKGEELRDIRDATELYRSTSFKLQIDALLPNVRPKYQRSAPLDKFLLSLHNHLAALPPIAPQHPLAASRDLLKKGIAVPYALPLPTEETNWKVAFEKPREILLVGSWALKTAVKAKDQHKYGIDVAVAMPESLFQEKDHLHGRFFHKRAFYLAVIAASLTDKKCSMNVDVLYESVSGDPRLTTLILRPKQDGSSTDFTKLNAQVRIIPALASLSPIPLSRLAPSRSNLRTSSAPDAHPETPTPLYNTALLLAATYKPHLLAAHALREAVPAFGDALALLRVWAHQRGYSAGDRLCVRGFEGRGPWWAALLELLVSGEEPLGVGASFGKAATKRKPLGKGLSSYQLFKAALDFLAKHDFSREPIFVRAKDGHRLSPQDYNSHEAVFVDSSSLVNLLAGVPLCSLEMLKYDAQLTLDLLDSSSISDDPFHSVFLKEQRDTPTRFDIIARVDLSSAKLRKPAPHVVLEHGSAYNALIATLISLLRQSLGNRARAIAVLHPSSQPRPASQAHPYNPSIIYIGVILDTEHAFRLVDHGPAAAEQDSEMAKRFRELWGDKAELRRFKDGSIVESVVWAVNHSDERAHIPSFIMRHILHRHCDISDEAVHTWQSQFDSVLRLPESVATLYRTADAATGFKAAMTAFDNLVGAMKALDEELPLAILNVSPIAESLRYTSVFSPVSMPETIVSVLPQCARYLAPMEIIIEFEKSGRWPDDLRAIQKIKLAFFERLASALMTSQKSLKASVVTGDGVSLSEIQDQASLEVITADGWAFRARIWHDREAVLLERIIDDKPHVPKHLKRKTGVDAKERQAALEARNIYHRRFIHAPRHHRAIAALCHRFTSFSGTVRLVKRWLASHWLLCGHVSEEVAELLCASVFLRHGTSWSAETANTRAGVPGSKERGFGLVVELLKDWEWSKGLFVPLYGSTEDAGSSGNSAVTITAGTRAGVWAVATEYDPDGHMWTSIGPDAIVARRVRAVAKATWDCLRGIETHKFDVLTLFAHPVEHYDFIIDLDPAILPRYVQSVAVDQGIWAKKGKYANIQSTEYQHRPLLPGFDPAQFLYNDLRRVYKDTFVIFHDSFGGARFGAVWDPSLKPHRPFRVLGGFSSMPLCKANEKLKEKDKSIVALNENSVLSEIERMGAGLITRIVLQE
ncbi:hypothetical protein AcV5_003115 [Taiwanofungus camphoratus]|nr:hypothetical protein AcV5_003115 [Antrodia cinnamomea]